MEELPDFEFFTTQLVESTKGPLASICKGGAIAFNKTSIVRYGIQNGQLVLLGFDSGTRTVGIKMIDNPADGARKVKIYPNGVAQIGATKFLRAFNITEKGKFRLNFDENKKILYFSLSYKFS